ncbi:MAG: ribosome small subunit-dependent GTPase A [Bacteroidales bacterium]|jgi:ribosome biogenesis GTPase|nr:ribosome small subunit-dependent GTPase A [Bacteroidales bacterium]MCK9448294.1 ribosome small subunit-dependent GTPase A [Bacteroidales bacterium]MDD3701704.1 ribosome small subunit-dependent GTPase A [Bacteroidales bacterium]MDY0369899.1 ribosome small subunit-dependent GTPase A [Bacteroidales bacterium]
MGVIKQGYVIRSTGSWYTVYQPNGETIECRLRGRYRLKGVRTTNPIAVGDEVSFQMEPERDTGVITHIHERKNFIIRRATKLSSAAHIIAANLDQAVLIATIAEPHTTTGFIDRFLVTAEAYHIPAIVVFNKIDIYNTTQMDRLSNLKKTYQDIGYQVIQVSALKKINLDVFESLLKDKRSLLSGHSGVGKSALVNAIDPDLDLKTGLISSLTRKGRHTTTFAEMFHLRFGGWIIDTPGINEFGLYDFEPEILAQRFPEMRQLMDQCRFANCTHRHEPDCAVRNALEKGEIAEFRYKNYLHMLTTDF